MTGSTSVDIKSLLGESEERLGGEIAGMWDQWRSAGHKARERWKELTKYVYATSTKDTTNSSNDHSHSTHIPVIAQIKDNLEANYMEALFPNDDWLFFKGFDQESTYSDKRRTIEAYLKTKHDLSDFTTTIQQLLSDWVEFGNVFAGVTYVDSTHKNEDGEEASVYSGPKVYRISPYDIVFNPMSPSFEESPKIIRSVKTLAELSRDVEEKPELSYSADVVNKIIESRKTLSSCKDTDIDKEITTQFQGFGSASNYYKSGKVEILEFFGDIWDTDTNQLYKNHVITVIDRKWVVRRQPLNTWSGRPHIYHCAWRKVPDTLWGMGPLDNLVGMQYMINHLENSRADAFDLMLSPDMVFKGSVEDIERYNGSSHYYVPENGDVRVLSPDTTVLNADFQIQNKQSQMEMAAGAPREAAGFRTPGEKTAFEFGQLMNGASRLFQHKINYFSREFLEKILEAEVEVARRNLNTIDIIETVDDVLGVSEFMTITRDDLKSNGRVRAVGARHYARNNQLVSNLNQFSSQLSQDPMMQQHFPSERLAKVWEDLLGFSNLDIMVPYGRVAEQLELQRLSQAATSAAQEESMIPLDEGEYDEHAEERVQAQTSEEPI